VSTARRAGSERGLTLLEVVIALLLFAMMAMFLLSGQANAASAIARAQVERETAELLRLRIDLAALEWEQYRDRDTEGEFPSRVSTRIIDEEKALGTAYEGYRWEVQITETIGAGAASRSQIADGDSFDLLFPEEGSAGETSTGSTVEDEIVQTEDVDRMLLIKVTVFPPGYDPSEPEPEFKPRSAWTAIHLPAEETEEAKK
jgi:prepilin-type N-terminal cleavage/methylation domain-containing protein